MMDSEVKGLRRRKVKRILLWTVGIVVIVALISVIAIFSFPTGT